MNNEDIIAAAPELAGALLMVYEHLMFPQSHRMDEVRDEVLKTLLKAKILNKNLSVHTPYTSV